jgi:hypothetical protein
MYFTLAFFEKTPVLQKPKYHKILAQVLESDRFAFENRHTPPTSPKRKGWFDSDRKKRCVSNPKKAKRDQSLRALSTNISDLRTNAVFVEKIVVKLILLT